MIKLNPNPKPVLVKTTKASLSLWLFLFCTGLLLSACSIHKIDVQQGNVITQEMLEKLTIGMEKKQVKRLLGTPLIEDPFHKDRWDYIYRYKSGITDDQQSAHVTLFFETGLLKKLDVRTAVPKESEVKKPALRNR